MNNLPCGYLLAGDEKILSQLSEGKDLVVDIGTCHGRSAAILSQRAKRVITIDVFEKMDLIQNIGSRTHYAELFQNNPHYYADVKLLLSRYPNITVVQELANEYAARQNSESVDLVFFDGDHSFTGLQRDFSAWYPRIKDQGILAFHDATNDNWDVQAYCNQFLYSFEEIKFPDIPETSIRAFYKV